MLLSLDGTGPVYQQIYRALKREIVSGDMKPATRLPSTRDLADQMTVSRNTVLLAYEQLLAEGYVRGKIGAGTFVADVLPEQGLSSSPPVTALASYAEVNLSNYARRAVNKPYRVLGPRSRALRQDFQYGVSSTSDFPFDIWRKLLNNRAKSSASEAFMYSAPEGSQRVREAIAGYLHRSRGVRCSPDQVLVVNGSQQAIDIITRALIDPGDITVLEDPSYPGARDVFLAAGSQLLPVPVDLDGLNVDMFPAAARRARIAYITPSHQFPTGVVMTLPKRLALLAWAKECGTYIVEDDYDSEFRYDDRPIESLQGLDPTGPVIYVGTLSKTLTPSLRVGYIVAPRELVQPLRTLKFLADRHTSTLQQDVLADFIGNGQFERYLLRVRKSNARRRALLLKTLKDEFGESITIGGENAGLHMVVWFQNVPVEQTDTLVSIAEANNIGVYSVSPYFSNRPAHAGLLLGYAALEEASIQKGIRRLAECLRPLLTANAAASHAARHV